MTDQIRQGSTTKTRRVGHTRWLAGIVGVVAMLSLAACGDDTSGDECSGRNLLPHISPVSFGQMFPDDPDDRNLGNATRSPYEWTLRLQAECEEVSISDICLEGPGADQYRLFFDRDEATSIPGQDMLVQVTYERADPAPIDNVSLIVQSNASNFPTLVVPFCAQVIAEGDDAERKSLCYVEPMTDEERELCASELCTPAVDPPAAGQRDDSLCGG